MPLNLTQAQAKTVIQIIGACATGGAFVSEINFSLNKSFNCRAFNTGYSVRDNGSEVEYYPTMTAFAKAYNLVWM